MGHSPWRQQRRGASARTLVPQQGMETVPSEEVPSLYELILIQISYSGCWKSKFKVTEDLVSPEAPLLGLLKSFISSPCPHVAFSLYMHTTDCLFMMVSCATQKLFSLMY